MDTYTIDTRKASGWDNFYLHCCRCYKDRDVDTIQQVMDYELARDYGFVFPRVRVKHTRTQGSYIRFRNQREYTHFMLKWA